MCVVLVGLILAGCPSEEPEDGADTSVVEDAGAGEVGGGDTGEAADTGEASEDTGGVADGGTDTGAEDAGVDTGGGTEDTGVADTGGGTEDTGRDTSEMTDTGVEDASDASDASDGADVPVMMGNSGSLLFDGQDDYVEIPAASALDNLNALTVEAWVKTKGSTSEQSVVARWRGQGPRQAFGMSRTPTYEKAEMSVGTTSKSCTAGHGDIKQGQWHHVAGTWSNSTGKPAVFIDGKKMAASSCSTSLGSTMAAVLVGAKTSNGNLEDFWSGWIDEVRIWSTARSESEIAATMSTKLTGNEADLVGYWDFDDGSGDTARDLSGSGKTGRLGSSSGSDAADPTWSGDTPF